MWIKNGKKTKIISVIFVKLTFISLKLIQTTYRLKGLDGSTNGIERERLISSFNVKNNGVWLFLLSTRYEIDDKSPGKFKF
jgi:hypothetical protein